MAGEFVKRLLKGQRAARWGNLRRTSPFSEYYGFDRGLPVDRFYIERFLERFTADVQGRVLEVQDPAYTRRYGGDRVTASEIVDVDESNLQATIRADLSDPGSLPIHRFDCVLLTQTLQYVNDPEVALANVWQSLAPGGVALVTVPCLSRIDPDHFAVDRWRFLPNGLETLLRRACPQAQLEVTAWGNLLTGVAYLMGLSAAELKGEELEHRDEAFSLVACARVRKQE